MRKYLIGFVVGLLLASAFPAYGAVSSLVGKSVQAENEVKVYDTVLDVKAINIDGTTYSPNRAIADALGLDISFSDGTIVFSRKDVRDMGQNEYAGLSLDALMGLKDGRAKKLDQRNSALVDLNDRIEEISRVKDSLSEGDTARDMQEDTLNRLEKGKSELINEINDIQADIDALDAEIEKLQQAQSAPAQ